MSSEQRYVVCHFPFLRFVGAGKKMEANLQTGAAILEHALEIQDRGEPEVPENTTASTFCSRFANVWETSNSTVIYDQQKWKHQRNSR